MNKKDILFFNKKIIWLSNLFNMSVPDEGYSKNASCAKNLISTFLLYGINTPFWSQMCIKHFKWACPAPHPGSSLSSYLVYTIIFSVNIRCYTFHRPINLLLVVEVKIPINNRTRKYHIILRKWRELALCWGQVGVE